VDAVASVPLALMGQQHVMLAALAVAWYAMGMQLMSASATKLATFSPETLPVSAESATDPAGQLLQSSSSRSTCQTHVAVLGRSARAES
jgi:hypothetical protein